MNVGAGPCACPGRATTGGCPYVFEEETETVMKEDAGTMNSKNITLSGYAIHFWKGGAGPGLLLLHAHGDAEMSWSRTWDQLSLSYTVVAPDLPGFGLCALW